MKLTSLLLSAGVLVISTAAITSTVVSQDKAWNQKETAGSQDWEKYGKVTENHRKLDKFVGTWDQTVKWWMYPDAEPTTSKSTATYKWILDKHYVQGDFNGEMDGKPFNGLELLGYDNFRGEYTQYWIDNMSTSPMTSTGAITDKQLTLTGKHDCAMTGAKDQPFKNVTKFNGPNSMVFEMWAPGPDGEMFKTLEVTSTRKGS